jgi:methyl-accepting chemotaxis protein
VPEVSAAHPGDIQARSGSRPHKTQAQRVGLSLRWQLLIAAVLLAVIPVAIMGYLLNRNTSDSLEDEAERRVSAQAQALQATLDEVVNDHASNALLLTGQDFLFFRSADLQLREDFLQTHGDVWTYASDITIVAADGTVLVGYAEPAAYPNQTEEQYLQRTLSLSEGEAFVGDVSPDPITGEFVINIAAPYYGEAGVAQGVVRIAWPVSNFNEFLASLAGGGELDVNVYDSNGFIIGSSAGIATDGMQTHQSQAAERAILGDTGVLVEDFAQPGGVAEESYVAYGKVTPSDRVALLDWAVTVASPASLVLEPVESNATLARTILVAVAILAALAAIFLSQFLVRPIRRLAAVAQEVAAGNYSARADRKGPAEVSTTGDAFNQMLDEITGLIQTREERDAIQRQVSRLLMEVSDVARGDLTVEANPEGVEDETLGSIAASFNYMVRQLRQIVSNVNETTNAVTSASTNIAERSTSLAEISTSNSRRIAETAGALDEMVLSIQHVTENARLSSTVALEARANAEAGAQAMRETITALQQMRDQIQDAGRMVARLGESSQEIGQTVQLISQIARQTNTLALNASIQAARAGQHGRGFAVVAEEVRKLAERAAMATRQIDSMVSTIRSETEDAVTAMTIGSRQATEGVDLANRTGTRLEEIDAVINRLGELIDSMSSAAEEQAATALDLAQAMRIVSSSTAESTESTQDAAQSATTLARLAERLRESVAVFRIGEDDGRKPVTAPMAAGDD